jgi:hypothetical protein
VNWGINQWRHSSTSVFNVCVSIRHTSKSTLNKRNKRFFFNHPILQKCCHPITVFMTFLRTKVEHPPIPPCYNHRTTILRVRSKNFKSVMKFGTRKVSTLEVFASLGRDTILYSRYITHPQSTLNGTSYLTFCSSIIAKENALSYRQLPLQLHAGSFSPIW